MFYTYTDIKYNDFYIIPKELISNNKYRDVSLFSKFFYGILLDRLNLSIKNNWFDDKGNYYFYFTVNETMKKFNISKKTAVKLYKELEENDLLLVIKQGTGKPNKLYLKKLDFHLEENDGKINESI